MAFSGSASEMQSFSSYIYNICMQYILYTSASGSAFIRYTQWGMCMAAAWHTIHGQTRSQIGAEVVMCIIYTRDIPNLCVYIYIEKSSRGERGYQHGTEQQHGAVVYANSELTRRAPLPRFEAFAFLSPSFALGICYNITLAR